MSIGVCVPVADDPAGLARLLAAVAALDHPRADVVVVVAVDGGDAASLAAAEAGGADVVLDLRPRAGSYAARNAAVDALPDHVTHVVFTDADCIPAPSWLGAHLEALRHADMSGGAVQVTLPDPATPASWVDRDRHLQQERYVRSDRYAATANLAVRRELLASLRFDARLRTGGDSDFGRRATAAGRTLVYTADAAVEHPARTTAAAVYRKVDRICGGMPDLAEHWAQVRLSRPAPRRSLVGRARTAGASRGPWWELRALWVDYRCQRKLFRSAAALRRRAAA